jgi:hypothetical protein
MTYRLSNRAIFQSPSNNNITIGKARQTFGSGRQRYQNLLESEKILNGKEFNFSERCFIIILLSHCRSQDLQRDGSGVVI